MTKVMPSSDRESRSLRALASVAFSKALVTRKGLGYLKLPEHQLKLTILKLDGSSFGVHVSRSATVAELKLAIQECFSISMPDDGKILWSLVWSHFCLSYSGKRLINDKEYIRSFGIKDGDQVQFIRHLMIDYKPPKRRSTNQSSGFKEGSESNMQKVCAHDGEDNLKFYDQQVEETVQIPGFKLSHLIKGWLSNSKLWRSMWKSEGNHACSRFPCTSLGKRADLETEALV